MGGNDQHQFSESNDSFLDLSQSLVEELAIRNGQLAIKVHQGKPTIIIAKHQHQPSQYRHETRYNHMNVSDNVDQLVNRLIRSVRRFELSLGNHCVNLSFGRVKIGVTLGCLENICLIFKLRPNEMKAAG